MDSSGRVFGFFVTFKSLIEIPNNILDITDRYLSRCELSKRILNDNYGSSECLHYFITPQGKLLWMNPKYTEMTLKTNEDSIMYPTIYYMITSNPDNYFLKEDLMRFFIEKGKQLCYYASINLEKGGVLEAKFIIQRLDSHEGIPWIYHIEVQPKLIQ